MGTAPWGIRNQDNSSKEVVMADNSLDRFIDSIRSTWGPLSSDVVSHSRTHLEKLVAASPAESWVADLHKEASPYHELHHDMDYGFELLSHTEPDGLYRPPHDHGRAWVMYAVQRGEMEMGTYAPIVNHDGRIELVKRDTTIVRAGQVMVYLPGDIHDTLCTSGPALLFRFTERNLKKEDKEEHRITRYVQRDGIWTVADA